MARNVAAGQKAREDGPFLSGVPGLGANGLAHKIVGTAAHCGFGANAMTAPRR